MEGTKLTELKCPICYVNFQVDDLEESLPMRELIGTLIIQCRHSCGEVFDITERSEMQLHEKRCKGAEASFTLSSVLQLTETSIIPKEIEKPACHLVKIKIAKSTEPSSLIRFATGGLNVSTNDAYFSPNFYFRVKY